MKKLLVVILFILSGCVYDPAQDVVEVRNNSNTVHYFTYSINDDIKSAQRIISIDSIDSNGKNVLLYPNYRAAPDSICAAVIIGGLKQFIDNECVNKTLTIFAITDSVMQHYSWEEICNDKLYDKKMQFTYDELKKLNQLIEFNN